MRFGGRSTIISAATALVLAVMASSVLAQSPAEARVLDIKCNGEVKRIGESNPLQLTSDDKGFPLQAGDLVRCTSAGSMVVQTPEGDKTHKFTDPPFKVEVIHEEPRFPFIAEELKRIGAVGGPRGAGSAILWPTANSAIRPEEFVILWKPVPSTISLMIEPEDSHLLVWGSKRISGNSGRLKSANAQTALKKYGKDATERLVLTLSRDKSHDTDEVMFSIFLPRDENALRAMLNDWDIETNNLARLLGRGYVFLRFGRFREAAAEYETALATAPNSRYLLVDARDAEARAGNMAAVTVLGERLKTIMKQRQKNAANE